MKLLGCLMTMMLVTPSLASDLKILSVPSDENGPSPCALTCSGVAKHSATEEWWNWTSVGTGAGRAATRQINIAECGFVTAPVVTTILAGPYFGPRRCPSVSLRLVFKETFWVFTVEDAIPSEMIENLCDVHWIATGFNC